MYDFGYNLLNVIRFLFTAIAKFSIVPAIFYNGSFIVKFAIMEAFFEYFHPYCFVC